MTSLDTSLEVHNKEGLKDNDSSINLEPSQCSNTLWTVVELVLQIDHMLFNLYYSNQS